MLQGNGGAPCAVITLQEGDDAAAKLEKAGLAVTVRKGTFELEALVALSHLNPSMCPSSARNSKVCWE